MYGAKKSGGKKYDDKTLSGSMLGGQMSKNPWKIKHFGKNSLLPELFILKFEINATYKKD